MFCSHLQPTPCTQCASEHECLQCNCPVRSSKHQCLRCDAIIQASVRLSIPCTQCASMQQCQRYDRPAAATSCECQNPINVSSAGGAPVGTPACFAELPPAPRVPFSTASAVGLAALPEGTAVACLAASASFASTTPVTVWLPSIPVVRVGASRGSPKTETPQPRQTVRLEQKLQGWAVG